MKKNFLKKKVLSLLLISILSTFASLQANSALAFSDIQVSDKNYEAINYLQEKYILNGYDDGTFKPNKAVNRAEFLKIVVGGSNISLDNNSDLPFTDIDHEAWYLPYIQKAYAENWVKGYDNYKFKPNQTISQAEALKILAKTQNWAVEDAPSDPNKWYEPYFNYADNHGYLDNSENFSASTPMTRGSISVIVYKALIDPTNTAIAAQDTKKPTTKTPVIKKPASTENNSESPDSSFTPNTFSAIPSDFFGRIKLSEELPNIFYKKETYIIKGDITSGTYDKATVFFNSEDDSIQKSFYGDVHDNHFEIPVNFDHAGNYTIGIIPGDSDSSITHKISVLADIPSPENPNPSAQTASDLDLNFSNNQTKITFKAPANTFKKIIFSQDNHQVTYLTRQDVDSFKLNYIDFSKFNEGEVNYHVETADLQSSTPLILSSDFSSTENKTFNAVEHTEDSVNENEISITKLPDVLPSPKKISLSCKAKTDMEIDAYVTRPDGFVDDLKLTTTGSTGTIFDTPIINKNNNFTFTYTPKSTGRYILEINDGESEAALNHPLYIGDVIPLIPDYLDQNERTLFTGNFDLNQERQDLIDLINKDRSNLGLGTLAPADELNNMAQIHSDDMKNNNYYGHYDLNNKGPDERRIDLGIDQGVGENVATDTSVRLAYESLMRSPGHRSNTIDPEFTRVGIGISLSKGYFLVTEEFSY